MEKSKQGVLEKRCKKHNPVLSKMGMIKWYSEIERRLKRGQKQKQCPVCKLWFFKDEF